MTTKIRRLTYSRIERSPQIQSWLEQFGDKRAVAIEMLLHLRFVSRDTYSEWLKDKLIRICKQKSALFAVRKFGAEVLSAWDDQGLYHFRPPESLGSEDLVQSVIANITKNNRSGISDHPNIETLRKHRVPQFVLIDDSIGSGQRVKGFLKRLFQHKTIRSWWSYGKFRIVILSFARVRESEITIFDGIPGSHHGIRIYPKKTKVEFISYFSFARENLFQRWGVSHQQILNLCMDEERVPGNRRRGYGATMANTVFYHSVPNNLPGVIWFQSSKWNALFPHRTLPSWLPELLEGFSTASTPENTSSLGQPNEEMIALLRLAKRGIHNDSSIVWHLGLDRSVISELVERLHAMNLITPQKRLTKAGSKCLHQSTPERRVEFNHSLYIPETWCADREPVQPSEVDLGNELLQTESDVGLLTSDGEVGQASLERTDAKTAEPSLGIMPEKPTETGNGHNAHGPSGPRES